MDVEGRVQLCCSVYDRDRFNVGHFLDTRIEDIQQARRKHPFCGPCKRLGFHEYSVIRSKDDEMRDIY
jgi:hypothetical protein